jgi:hypothetical protein
MPIPTRCSSISGALMQPCGKRRIEALSAAADWAANKTIDVSTVDLSDPALNVSITVYIKDREHCIHKTGSLSDGKVVIVGPGFQWQFEDTDLHCLCAGTYSCGVKVIVNGFIDDLIVGDVAIIEGN